MNLITLRVLSVFSEAAKTYQYRVSVGGVDWRNVNKFKNYKISPFTRYYFERQKNRKLF